ncbi:MAG: hypothetical protein J0I15_07020 [Herbaspirillum huttiense]|uniref:hypothetical protein n=1 Tax=Herbaspirillum huttiense TaxID=863372 RepID=UPI001AC24E45|nr:hypothetical protein [Herbaspirillum huttiense]MBN9356181.1 hypothetical protein [Herbaspirillum huttiense]
MKEGPLLMNGAMVRATLAGDKTNTRREVTTLGSFGLITGFDRSDTPGYDWHFRDSAMRWHDLRHTELLNACPYGQVGDRLYVRETCKAEELDDGSDGVRYLADDTFSHIRAGAEETEAWHKLFHYRGQQGAVVPSIHMPRWASRIMLEITGVRVERLQDISAADALAEGIDAEAARTTLSFVGMREICGPVAEFSVLWESINGPGSWDSNPWVWVVEFRRIEG